MAKGMQGGALRTSLRLGVNWKEVGQWELVQSLACGWLERL